MDAPRWMRDLSRFLPLKSHFVLSGNVRDRYPLAFGDGPAHLMPLVEYLAAQLARAGIERSIAYEPIHGFRVPPAFNRDASGDQAIFESLGLKFDNSGWANVSHERFFETIPKLVEESSEPVAVIADFAARLIQRPDHLLEVEHRGFTQALVLSHRVDPKAHPKTGEPYFNPVIWIVEKEGDLPDWFTFDNPRLRHIPIPKPDHEIRYEVAGSLIATVPGGAKLSAQERETTARRFVEATMDIQPVVGRHEFCLRDLLRVC